MRPAEQHRIRTLVPTSVSVLAMVLGALAFMSVPALASKPEVPEVQVLEVHSTGAVVRGVLNPNAVVAGEGGTYQFVYRPSTSNECQGAGEVKAPEAPGVSMGPEREETPFEFLGSSTPLIQGTEYAICLVVTEAGKTEPAISPAITFKTPTPPETPEAKPATTITGDTAVLNGVLNPTTAGEPGSYSFLYAASATTCEGNEGLNGAQLSTPTQPSTGQLQESVSAIAEGLRPKTRYMFCLRVENGASESALSAPASFETSSAPPVVTSEAATDVTSTEAVVTAQISPGGASTSYRVEYEPGKFTAAVSVPASSISVVVQQRLSALRPGTEYHFRFIATNEVGAGQGSFVSFSTGRIATPTESKALADCQNSTFTGFTATLPDCRAYELVSPAGETGEVYVPGDDSTRLEDVVTTRPFRAAADGQSVAYVADPGPIGGDGSSANNQGNEYLAARDSDASVAGWHSLNITPPVGEAENPSSEREYEYFASDLSVGVLHSTEPLLAANPEPQGPEGCNVVYSRDGGLSGSFYRALFTEAVLPGVCGLAAGGRGGDNRSSSRAKRAIMLRSSCRRPRCWSVRRLRQRGSEATFTRRSVAK